MLPFTVTKLVTGDTKYGGVGVSGFFREPNGSVYDSSCETWEPLSSIPLVRGEGRNMALSPSSLARLAS